MLSARARFVVRFVVAIAVLYTVMALAPVDRAVVVPFSRGIATVSAAALDGLGGEARARGTIVQSKGFAADIKNGCNGLEAMLLLAATIAAFPAPAKWKAIGLIGGSFAIQLANLGRVIVLVILGRDHPALFETFHVTVGQIVMFLLTIAIFLAWSSRVEPRRDAARA